MDIQSEQEEGKLKMITLRLNEIEFEELMDVVNSKEEFYAYKSDIFQEIQIKFERIKDIRLAED